MQFSFAPLAIALMIAGVLLPTHAAAQLRVGGTGTATGVLEHLAPGFAATTGAWLIVVPGLGSSGAVRAVADNKLDIAIAGRPLRAAERAGGLTQLAIFRTAFVMATSHRKPQGFKSTEFADIYKAPLAQWPDGTPIRIILRPRTDSDTELLGELFPDMREALETARLRSELPIGATDQDNADLAERIKGSLTATTTSQIKTEKRDLRILPIDGVEPTLANVENGAYPFVKKLYVVARAANVADVARFVEFLRSSEGLKLLREAEVLPEAQ